MKKIIFGISCLLLGVSLIGCAMPKEGKTVTKGSVPMVKKDETTHKLRLTKSGSTATVTLISQFDDLLTERVVVEGDYASLGEENRDDVEARVEALKKSEEKVTGVTRTYDITDTGVIFTRETDFKKADIQALGVPKERLAETGKFPSVKLRLSDYKDMGYEEYTN